MCVHFSIDERAMLTVMTPWKEVQMRRKAEAGIRKWLTSESTEPLLLKGPRRVGKTFLVKTWLQDAIGAENHVYLDFQTDLMRIESIFEGRTDVDRIVADLELYLNKDIRPKTSVLVFDEVQLCEKALNSLRFFAQSPYRVIATGSLLGVTLRKQDDRRLPYPSDVRHLTLHPMDFEEFLWAMGEERMADGIRSCFQDSRPFVLHDQALEWYRKYLVVGGMPKAVDAFARGYGLQRVREIQAEIDQTYISDMPAGVAALARSTWDSIPRQLARETTRKFKYGDVVKGGRANRFEEPLAWLESAGIVDLCRQTNSCEPPLIPRDGGAFFKAYLADVGLLHFKSGLMPNMVLDRDSYALLSSSFRGAFAENYVMQALKTNGFAPLYWTPGNSSAEIEFVISDGQGSIVPIEVKSGSNVRSRSLRNFMDKTGCNLGYRISALNFSQEGPLKSIPLYAAFYIE